MLTITKSMSSHGADPIEHHVIHPTSSKVVNMKKILIYGSGGYIESIVLPCLQSKFPGKDIVIMSNRPVHALNIARKYGVTPLLSLDDIFDFDTFFLASSPLDYPEFIRRLPFRSHVWIEKPVCEMSSDALDDITSAVVAQRISAHVGLNKRYAISITSYVNSDSIEGQINLNIPFDPGMWRTSWRQYLLHGGVYWADGIHAFDLALYLLGENANLSFSCMNCEGWKAIADSPRGKIYIHVGNSASNYLVLNGQQLTDFWSPATSIQSFETNLAGFLQGESNWDSAFSSHSRIIAAGSSYCSKHGCSGFYA